MSEFIRTAGESLIEVFMIDRHAIGMNYEVAAIEFYKFFQLDLSEYEYKQFAIKYADKIENRKKEMREFIYSSGTFGKLLDISDILYKTIKSTDSTPREVSALAATLRGYLDVLSNLGLKKEPVQVKTQNNFIILQTLARDGVIEIKNEKQLKYLLDGEIDE